MKNLRTIFGKALGGLALALLMAGCADILNSPAAPEGKPGKAVLTINSGPARTVSPSIDQFEKITLTITGKDPSEDLEPVDAINGSATVTFPVGGGVWDITAKAYLSAEDVQSVAESTAHEFSWGGGVTEITGDRVFILEPTGGGDGTLQYTITVGDSTLTGGSRIQIEDGAGVLDLDTDNFTDGVRDISASVTDQTAALAAGLYTVDILLVEDETNHTAVWRESVVILPGLITELSFTAGAGNFLDPAVRAALTDITDTALQFGGTAQNLGGVVITTEFQDPASPALTIAVPAAEAVYFTLAKTAAHDVAVGGDDASDVELVNEPAEDSIPSDTLVVFKVDTEDLAEDGGTKSFTLTVTKEGMSGVVVAVTLDMESPPLGAGLYINSGTDEAESLAAGGFSYEGASPGLLQAALDWLTTNAVDDTKYVILVDADNEISAPWASKGDSSGVKITLRGLDEERAVYWNAISDANLFTINGGTTLVLGENIAVGGGEQYISLGSSTNNAYSVFFIKDAGILEMLAGSKISRVEKTILIDTMQNSGTFMMRGGNIEDNIYPQSGSLMYLVRIRGNTGKPAKFEMFDGAEIKNNKDAWSPDSLPSNGQNEINAIVWNGANSAPSGTVQVMGGGTQFIMHGGAIKNNALRGVYFTPSSIGASAVPVVFTMEGGEISGNGTGTFAYNDRSDYVVWGAGIYSNGGIKMTMTGGSIKNNGHANSLGGGMALSQASSAATVPIPVLLDGSVSFENNAILVQAPSAFNNPVIYLGSSFSNPDASPIVLEAGYANTSTSHTASSVSLFLNGKSILKTPVENGVNLAVVKNQFELRRVVSANTASANFVITDYNTTRVINDDGTLAVSVIE
jgi:hypothetical protein